MATLIVAGLSVRLLAEAAARDGHQVIALDLFGDADTRRASSRWLPVGEPGTHRLDPARVLEALGGSSVQDALRGSSTGRGEVLGWIAGSGFEGMPGLLEAGAARLPLIGTPAEAVRRVRDPRIFFDALAAHGIAHPAVRFEAPADPRGWLSKDAHGCGGWHIRQASADDAALGGSRYVQRAMPGTPMSATFIANGREASVVGINQLIVRPIGALSHVYCGCIGPVGVPDDLARQVGVAVRALAAAFALRGWCSLDFMRDGDAIGVLEVNPRPPASLGLYARRGLVDAHLRACLHGQLPAANAFETPQVAGQEIVYTRRDLHIDDAAARHLAQQAAVHDLPVGGTHVAMGDPVCSVSAAGANAAQVAHSLSARRDALLDLLETHT